MAVLPWHVRPAAACGKDIQDSVENFPIIKARTSSFGGRGHEALEEAPLLVCEFFEFHGFLLEMNAVSSKDSLLPIILQ